MARVRYSEQLDALRAELSSAIGRVAASVTEATRTLLSGDLAAAEAIIDGDRRIDSAVEWIEEECFSILALQAPVAGGLRQVLAAMRIAAEVSRSGDLVVNVAKAARRIYGHRVPDPVAAAVRDMSDRACLMFVETADACAAADDGRLAVLRSMDGELDAAQVRLLNAVFDAEAAGGMDPQMAIQIAVVGRFFERLGDHAVNVVEQIAYAAGAASGGS